MPVPTTRVTLYTRAGCHLCDDARAVVERVCARAGEPFAEVDLDGGVDPEQRRRWTDRVPVVTVDGTVVDFWRVDPDRLRGALDGAPRRAPREGPREGCGAGSGEAHAEATGTRPRRSWTTRRARP